MMKNQLIYTIFAAGTVLGLASCNNDVVSSLLHDENDRISFTAATDNDVTATTRGLTEMSQGVRFRDTQAGRPLMLSATVTGRAQTTTRGHRFGDEAEDELTAFRVSAIQADANISGEDFAEATPNLFYNLKAQKNAGDVFEIAQDYYWPVSSDKLWFYAYTPCDDANVVVSSQTTGGAQKITFTVDPVVTNQVDLMTADAVTTGFNDVSGTQKKASVPLTFRHELTAIRFVIGEQWLAGSIKSVAIRNVHGVGTLTIGDDVEGQSRWEWKNAAGTDITTLNDFTLRLDKSGVTGTSGEEFMDNDNGVGADFSNQYFLMIPQSFDDNDNAVIEVKYQDGEAEYTVTAPLKGQDAWVRNTTVTYAISSHTLTTLKINSITWPDESADGSWNGPKAGFAEGDEVGLYVVNPDGVTIPQNRRNIRCTYDGNASWTIHHPEGAPVYKLPGYQYFFYYPYTPEPDQKYPVAGQSTTNTTASAFFGTLVNGWAPAAIQNTLTALNKQDLQIGKGVDVTNLPAKVDVQMTHQMNIGVITLGTKSVTGTITYPIDGGTYNWTHATQTENITASAEFKDNLPYLNQNNNKYYYVFKPVSTLEDPGTQLKGMNANGTAADWSWYMQTTNRGVAQANTVYTSATNDQTINDALVIAEIPALTYTGSVPIPTISVTLSGTALTKGTDYTVTYKDSNNETVAASDLKDVGTYTAYFTPAGSYSGDVVERTFAIQPLTTLAALKAWVNNGNAYSGYLGYYVNSDGTISTSDASSIGKIGWISTSNVDNGVNGSRILVFALSYCPEGLVMWKTSSTVGDEAYGSQTALNGYAFTTTHNNSTYPAALAAYNYSASRPDGASRWFLPSKAQFVNMYWTMRAEGTGHLDQNCYTATEATDDTAAAAWCVFPGGYYGLGRENPPNGQGPENAFTTTFKTNLYYIRTCFAF
ncbi:MAG: hypothetical protein J5913_01290 [Prevotella sp.]|nr:hypothetical protein [Prevotella sp.]